MKIVKTVYYVPESLLLVGPKLLCELLLLEIKSFHNLEELYTKIKVLHPRKLSPQAL